MINQIKKLPDAEFEIMKTIWSMSEPVTSSQIAEKMSDHNWKLPTLISFLKRLIEKGFLRTEKTGKERQYYSLVSQSDYLKFETENFFGTVHNNSLSSLVTNLYETDKLSSQDIDELIRFLEEVKDRNNDK